MEQVRWCANSLDFLLDFVRVKDWTREELRRLQLKYRLINSKGGEEKGYEDYVHIRQTPERSLCLWMGSGEPDVPSSSIVPEKIFFAALTDLQKQWRAILERTSQQGHDLEFLSGITARAKWQMVETGNPFTPRLGPFLFNTCWIDQELEYRYLDAVLVQGGDFSKLRICDDPACGKMFAFNRPKQKYCGDDCRRRYNNRRMIETGYLRDHQQKKRDAGDEKYMR